VAIIRPGRADEPQVRSLLAELDRYLAALYAPEDNHILDESALLRDDVSFFVAERDGAVVGCGALRAMPPAPGDVAYGEVKRMVVSPAVRGQGIARRLLQRLEAAAIERALPVARLETGRDQHEAARLYERAGYVPRGSFGGYPDNGLSLFYEKRLA